MSIAPQTTTHCEFAEDRCCQPAVSPSGFPKVLSPAIFTEAPDTLPKGTIPSLSPALKDPMPDFGP